jgi:hypothetical protein
MVAVLQEPRQHSLLKHIPTFFGVVLQAAGRPMLLSDILNGEEQHSGVDASIDFYRYDPIQKYGPSDCTTYINGIIDKMDRLIAEKNTEAIQQLKEIFGLGTIKDIRDFALTIAYPRKIDRSISFL